MTEQASQLTQALARQVEQMTSLASLLEKELQLISSRDAESLMNLLDEKAVLLVSIYISKEVESTLSYRNTLI